MYISYDFIIHLFMNIKYLKLKFYLNMYISFDKLFKLMNTGQPLLYTNLIELVLG